MSSIKKYPIALKRRIVQAVLENMLGTLEDISYRNIEDILDLVDMESGENKWLKPVEGIIVFRISEILNFACTGSAGSLDPEIRSYVLERSGLVAEQESSKSQIIKIGEETELNDFDLTVKAETVNDPGDYQSLPASKALIDQDMIAPPVIVRSWSEGDRFYPLGMEGSKKLQDFFIDNKVPVNLRKKIPVFCDREKIIWVGNMRIDSRVRVTPGTREFLSIELFEK